VQQKQKTSVNEIDHREETIAGIAKRARARLLRVKICRCLEFRGED
jgi:hypothetical protein